MENKVYCPEHTDQTQRYAVHYSRFGHPGKNLFLVFLTPDGKVPACSQFKPLSYFSIRQMLCGLQVGGAPGLLIQHFTEHIFYDMEKEHYGISSSTA